MPPLVATRLDPKVGWAKPHGANFSHLWLIPDEALCGRTGPMTHVAPNPDGTPCYGCLVALARI